MLVYFVHGNTVYTKLTYTALAMDTSLLLVDERQTRPRKTSSWAGALPFLMDGRQPLHLFLGELAKLLGSLGQRKRALESDLESTPNPDPIRSRSQEQKYPTSLILEPKHSFHVHDLYLQKTLNKFNHK